MDNQLALVARNIYRLMPEGGEPVDLIEGIFVVHSTEYTPSGDRQTVAKTYRCVAPPKAWRKVAEDIVAWADQAERKEAK